MKGFENRIGGLEKEDLTGDVSYDPLNHEKMTKLRAQKISNISGHIPEQTIDTGPGKGKVLLLGWGSTYGVLKSTTEELLSEGYEVAHAQVRYLNPLPRKLGEILRNFDHVIVPENNNGQFVRVIRDHYLVPAQPLNKIRGLPFSEKEVKTKVKEVLIQVEVTK